MFSVGLFVSDVVGFVGISPEIAPAANRFAAA